MKKLMTILALAFFATGVMAAEPAKAPEKKEELNCVKKDKAGKCPPAPKSPKPTPKKKAEAK
jgi:hypothetical protein